MDTLDGAPWPVVALAAGGLFFGALPLLWMLRRIGRFVARRPQVPVGAMRYFMALGTSSVLLGVGVAMGGILFGLRGYHAFTKRTRVAEVQCVELAPAKMRLTLVPIDGDGQRGATATYDLAGDEWTVGGEVLRFRPFLTMLGVSTVHKVTRVEGRWTRAEDARAHLPTAFDVDGGASTAWLTLEREGARGPLKWLIAGAHGGAVSQQPDTRAVFDLSVTDDGYILDKHAL